MSKNDAMPAPPLAADVRCHPSVRAAWIAFASVTVAFALPLYRLAAFAFNSELYSYILLVPVVSAYIIWQRRTTFPTQGRCDRTPSIILLLAAAVILVGYLIARMSGLTFAREDDLALTTLAFLLTATGAVAWFLSRPMLAALTFPAGFLLFAIPIPTAAMTEIETLMQHGSAFVAQALFNIAGTAVFYENLNFQLPGITLFVAPECSGMRSTMALTIVSVVTGYLFLRTPGRRVLITAAVVPLALIRNGFRIFTIGELCVHFGPDMIDSFIHRRGGPIFFALSLVPFFALVLFLQRQERTKTSKLPVSGDSLTPSAGPAVTSAEFEINRTRRTSSLQ